MPNKELNGTKGNGYQPLAGNGPGTPPKGDGDGITKLPKGPVPPSLLAI